MRKLIVEEWISLDGFVSDKNGKVDFFIGSVRKNYTDDHQLKFLETIDCILFGRKTYEQFAALWPDRPTGNDMLAHKINNEQKIVFSSTLSEAPWRKWQKAAVESGNPIAKVRQIKSSLGKNIVLWGSISLAQSLMKENLVDEYHFHVCPSLTAGGRNFFTEEINPTSLRLVGTKHYKTGVVFLNYQPVNT